MADTQRQGMPSRLGERGGAVTGWVVTTMAVWLCLSIIGAAQERASSGQAQPSPSSQAQPSPSVPPDMTAARIQVSFRGLLGFPVGDFDDNVGLSGGIGGDVAYRIGTTPFRLGGSVNALWYGQARRRVPLSETIPDVLVDVTTSSGLVTSHGMLRVQPIRGRVRPYADGVIGFNYVFTQTSADLGNGVFQEQRNVTTTNLGDFAFSVGGGAGVAFELRRWSDGRFSLDAGARYIFGGEASYLTRRPGVPVTEVGDLQLNRSRTDVITLVFGGAVEF